ncbi:uncharacterized protein LOC131248905 [Magnolia sinica]|uniref:uncharacterized protein LOC131248905 n=1 Tax=Magnolia sinica TaxID=86752 RepID=UPI002659E861|nr:uncharacterized protein LOC131248905 [Magnolia sinica]XP_058105400.1 uncharacterized protein LOC131248905 [Magnolia sinica]
MARKARRSATTDRRLPEEALSPGRIGGEQRKSSLTEVTLGREEEFARTCRRRQNLINLIAWFPIACVEDPVSHLSTASERRKIDANCQLLRQPLLPAIMADNTQISVVQRSCSLSQPWSATQVTFLLVIHCDERRCKVLNQR